MGYDYFETPFAAVILPKTIQSLSRAVVTLLPSGNVTCKGADYFAKSLKTGKRNSQSSRMSMNRDVFPTEKRNFCEEASKVFREIGTWLKPVQVILDIVHVMNTIRSDSFIIPS